MEDAQDELMTTLNIHKDKEKTPMMMKRERNSCGNVKKESANHRELPSGSRGNWKWVGKCD